MPMKTIILTVTQPNYEKPSRPHRTRFVIDINEAGDVQIRDERAPGVERDSFTYLGQTMLTVEAA